jgi:hypothetical protein
MTEATIDEDRPSLDEPLGIGAEDEALNDLLSRWHSWACDERTALGYPTVSVTAKQYRASRQYDDANGALDQDVENVIMDGVNACVWSIREPFRTALHINARNLSTGAFVWRSPRLPEDQMACAFMVSDARGMLIIKLRDRGLF